MESKYPRRVRAALACKIVNLDRVKFNEAVANKHYPCAPSTLAGSARIFDEAALLPLFFFARLTDFGISAGRAGHLACEMAAVSRQEHATPASRIILVQGTMGSHLYPSMTKGVGIAKDQTEVGYDPEHEAHGTHFPGLGRVLFSIDFYIKHVREIISDKLDYEFSIIGADDDA